MMGETELVDGSNDILYFAPTDIILEKLREAGNNIVTADLLLGKAEVCMDITRLPFRDGVFDAIVCSHVLEHVLDDSAAMSEMYRVLDWQGEALIMVPKDKERKETYEDATIVSPEARRNAFGQEDHVRWYGRDFVQRLEDCGFVVSVETYADSMEEEQVEKYGLKVYDQHLGRLKYEDIHHCRKVGC